MSFSDYVANTFFESLYAEQIGGTQLTIPGIKTLFDKHCPMCRSVIAVKFADNDEVQSRARLWNARKAFVIGADARLACHHLYVFDSNDCELYLCRNMQQGADFGLGSYGTTSAIPALNHSVL